MPNGLRLIKLSDASSPTKTLQAFHIAHLIPLLIHSVMRACVCVRCVLVFFSYQNSAGYELTQWPSLA